MNNENVKGNQNVIPHIHDTALKRRFSARKSKQYVWKFFSTFLKLFFKKPEIINLAGKLPEKAIYVANHSAMAGPVIYNLYFPVPLAPLGAYPMLGDYKSRFYYLRDVYFMQKRNMKKSSANFLAWFEAYFSIMIYKGMQVIPSYPDGRLIHTIKQSVETIDNNRSVIIFPENSQDGYHEVLKSFSAGFVTLAERYNKTHEDEIPVIPVYYHKDKSKMVIGEPVKLSDFKDKNLTRNQIAEEFCNLVNGLFHSHVENA